MIFHCISAKVQVVKKKSTAGGEGGGGRGASHSGSLIQIPEN